MKIVLISLVFLFIASTGFAAKEDRCMDQLAQLIAGEELRLVETGMNDGKPLTLVFRDLSREASTVSVLGTKKGYKPGEFQQLDGRPRRIKSCQLIDRLVTLQLDRIKIQQQSAQEFMASCCLFWSSKFIMTERRN